jgi:hypothetical protein
MKPNIFSIATKELSQDGFFTWFLQWADDSNRQYDPELNETAKDFVRLLLGQSNDYQITKVEAGRQWENIDIRAEINDEYFIGIEDKTNTGEHSGQLDRYQKIATDYYKDKNYTLVFVYLKTGNESLAPLNEIKGKGWAIVDRKIILQVLNKRPINNEIFNEFTEYLTEIENQTNLYTNFENINSNWRAAEGFYIRLQELITEWTDWGYVANQTGGFLGFWYYWTNTKTNQYCLCLRIQIENSIGRGDIKVVIKIDDWEPNIETLYQIFSGLQSYANKHGLSMIKPDRYKTGKNSTVAIVQNPFSVDSNGILDIAKFISTLKKIEQILDEYCV